MLSRRSALAALPASLLSRAALAQSAWPSRAINIIVPFGPGGGTDILARLLAQHLAPALGQSVVVDNRAGATGTVGMAALARSRPDGYTLAVAPNGTFAMAPPLLSLPYDNDRAFAPIGLLATNAMFVCVHPQAPWRSLAELLDAARAQPGQLTYASSGAGATNHLGVELMLDMSGTQMTHVSYRSAAQAAQAVMTREAAISLADAAVALPYLRSGELRALAVTSVERSSKMPDVPTVAEGGLAGYRATVDLGLFAPAGTPQPILDRLADEARRAMLSDEMKSRLDSLAMDAIGGRPAEFAAYQAGESRKWAELIRRRNIRLE
ncbi:Bug family tripartite tricarboxylate transporter substrate binding protein [Roseococcus sp.]|uniref:Bug family tripartite tricarboxylate transporter substrate binding protein n=1 Tax=Roseococcus sp. TaxID=2109646 RepID=UPI003BABA804